jgi:hypothetical protein
MVAFFGCMYFAALGPEESVELRPENLVSLPRPLLSQHLKKYPPGPDGRIFTGPRGRRVDGP